jgi:hypothetical protein
MVDDDDEIHARLSNGGQSHFDMDEAFCARMRKAIEAGLEKAPIGVVTTPQHAQRRTKEKTPSTYTLGAHATQTLTPPGDRMAQPPGSIDVSAGLREYNADHVLVLGVGAAPWRR